MNKDKNLQYACLFGGGAIRGAAHIGVLRALSELGIEDTLLAGSSVGSIVAALRAVGYSADEIAEVFLNVNFELFRDISFNFSGKFALSKGDIFLDWFRNLIESKFYGSEYKKGENLPVKFSDLKRDLIVITTNIKDFSCSEFSNFETPDYEVAMAVRISCCMPGLMSAIAIDDKLLVDGDLLKGKPMWQLSDNIQKTSDRILEIRLEGSFSGNDSKPIEYVNGIYSCMTYCETDFIKNIYQNYDKYDCLLINTGDAVLVDFNSSVEKRKEIVDMGYVQTKNYFEEFLPNKKKMLSSIYNDINSKLKLVINSINRKKYLIAKNILAEIFITIYDSKNVLDSTIYSKLKNIQLKLWDSVKPGLLGTSSCNDRKIILELLYELSDDLTVKLSEPT